jgi:hypothetical protein
MKQQLEKRIDDTWRCKREFLKQIDEVETKKKQLKDLRWIRNPERIDENELRHMRRVTLPFCSNDIPEEIKKESWEDKFCGKAANILLFFIKIDYYLKNKINCHILVIRIATCFI